MIFNICRSYRFEAAHHLPLFPLGHKCQGMHGHNYRVSVMLCGELNAAGVVQDFGMLDAYMWTLIASLDHKILNDIIENPTAENIVDYVWTWLKKTAVSSFLSGVRVYENDDSWAEIAAC